MAKIAIIWAGAAGMMAAATLLEQWVSGTDIFLFDKNPRLGVKVALTGGGRCNVTTAITKSKELLRKYIRGGDFLRYAFEVFWPRKVYGWFEENGAPLYAQSDNRVFPRSDVGQDIVDVFGAIFMKNNLQMRLWEEVTWVSLAPVLSSEVEKSLSWDNATTRSSWSSWQSNTFALTTKIWTHHFDALIIATGGNAYAHTGSAGDGYAFARSLGHSITPLGPSLTSLEAREIWCADVAGISLENARLEATLSDGKKVSAVGPMVFTHFGISGPATFTLSAHLAFEKIGASSAAVTTSEVEKSLIDEQREKNISVSISLDASKDFQKWDSELRLKLESEPKKLVRTILSSFLPARLTDVIMTLSRIDKERVAAHLSKEDRKELVHLLSGKLTLTISKRRPWDEFVTAGGVNISEVHTKTMESILIPGLYFGGEVLDIDAVTGGFNLQAAWATGRVAGLALHAELTKQ